MPIFHHFVIDNMVKRWIAVGKGQKIILAFN
jgi:hypothetical protein